MQTFKVENAQGYMSNITVINDVYDEDTDQYYVQLRIDDIDLWLTKDQADNISAAMESTYPSIIG